MKFPALLMLSRVQGKGFQREREREIGRESEPQQEGNVVREKCIICRMRTLAFVFAERKRERELFAGEAFKFFFGDFCFCLVKEKKPHHQKEKAGCQLRYDQPMI